MARKFEGIDAYIAALPAEVRPIAESVRGTIRQTAPDCVEAMKYDMPTFKVGDTPLVYFAVWKKHLGVYPVYRGTDAFEATVAPYREKKDTVRFPLDKPIPHEVLVSIVRSQLARLQGD
jgi:uncharacterized protein YdhG (YjbR/CyaY superfamily)